MKNVARFRPLEEEADVMTILKKRQLLEYLKLFFFCYTKSVPEVGILVQS